MPGLIGSFVGVVAAAYFGNGNHSVALLAAIMQHGRKQALYQFIEICVTLGLAIVGGLITGGCFWLITRFIYPLWAEDYYNDRAFWSVPGDYPLVVRRDENEMSTYLKTHGQEIVESQLDHIEPKVGQDGAKLKRGPTRTDFMKV